MNNSKKRIAFSIICERSSLYQLTLNTLLDSSDDYQATDDNNNISYLKLAKMVAIKRHPKTCSTFVDTTIEGKDIAREVVKDFLAFSAKMLLDDIREENNILDDEIEVLKIATN